MGNNLTKTNQPNWPDIKELLTQKKTQIEKEYIKLKTKIKKAEADGRMDMKIEEIYEFWRKSSQFYNMFVYALMGLSNNYTLSSELPDIIPFTKVDFFDELCLRATEFEFVEGSDNLKKGEISISYKNKVNMGLPVFNESPLGQILFIAELNSVNYVIKFNIILSGFGESKRILTINNWSSYFFTYDYVERLLASAIIQLIDTIPLYKETDFN
jgi:hypothetical protein